MKTRILNTARCVICGKGAPVEENGQFVRHYDKGVPRMICRNSGELHEQAPVRTRDED